MRLFPFGTPFASYFILLALSFNATAALTVDQVRFFGGGGEDVIRAMAVDPADNRYVTGWTSSTVISGKSWTLHGSRDVFVAKLDSSGKLLGIQVFGGVSSLSSFAESQEQGEAIVVGPQGYIYVTGTVSGSLSLPGLGLLDAIVDGGCKTQTSTDAFILVLSPDLAPLYMSCIGRPGANDRGHAIAVDANGDIYLGGSTAALSALSSDFPVTSSTPGNMQGFLGFILKLNNPLRTGAKKIANEGLIYSTLLGGSGQDQVLGLAIDALGQAHVTGTTNSTDFPVAMVPSKLNGTGLDTGRSDAFITTLSADGSQWLFSRYLGGAGDDQGNAIILDASDNVFVAGETQSSDLPVSSRGGAFSGGIDAFVLRMLPTNASAEGQISYLRYLGTSGNDRGLALALDQSQLLISGVSSASGLLATVSSFSYQGGDDAFMARLNGDGSIVESLYLGGQGDDAAHAIQLDPAGGVLIAGASKSTRLITNMPASSPQSANASSNINFPDGFLIHLTGPSASTGSSSSAGNTASSSESSGATDGVSTNLTNFSGSAGASTPRTSGGGGGMLWLSVMLVGLLCCRSVARSGLAGCPKSYLFGIMPSQLSLFLIGLLPMGAFAIDTQRPNLSHAMSDKKISEVTDT